VYFTLFSFTLQIICSLLKQHKRHRNENHLSQTIGPDAGFAYLVAASRKEGFTDVEIMDLFNNPQGLPEVENCFLYQHKPQIVGFRMFSLVYLDVETLSTHRKKCMSYVTTLARGSHPSLMADDLLSRFPSIDYAFQGEAELCLSRLVQLPASGHAETERLHTVPSLMWQHYGTAVANKIHRVENLDSLGMQARDAMNIPLYNNIDAFVDSLCRFYLHAVVPIPAIPVEGKK